jgi:hypothetical protein
VELYNPADLYSWFAEAAREAAGLPDEPDAAEGLMDVAGIAPDETFSAGEDAYAAAADEWAATQPVAVEAEDDDEAAARQLYDLALEYQERSQRSEAHLLGQFESAATKLTDRLGDLVVVDDDDERLTLTAGGGFRADVVPEDAGGEWRTLATPEELVEYYDPTDVFGDLADAIAEAWPEVAPEMAGDEDDEVDEDEVELDLADKEREDGDGDDGRA